MLRHNQQMLVLALDTTTRPGSLAVVRDGSVLVAREGDADQPHAQQLPAALMDALRSASLALADVDVFAVAVGPGSFTGLRIGIASIQGLAFAGSRPVVGVSGFDALAVALHTDGRWPQGAPLGMWLDAQRQEVFAAAVERDEAIGDPLEGVRYLAEPEVGIPPAVAAHWRGQNWFTRAVFAGAGAGMYREAVGEAIGRTPEVVEPAPMLAPAIGMLAERRAVQGQSSAPHALRPLYIRRSDAELARDRRQGSMA